MITTTWPRRPLPAVADSTVWWKGTPRSAADLTRLRRELGAVVLHRSWQVGGDADLEKLLLVFEELASNGLRHGRPPVHVCAAGVPTGWLLDVSDGAAELPPAPARDRDAADGGMGLPLVARLSAAHGWMVRGERKHVWAHIDAATVLGSVPPLPRRPAPPAGAGVETNLARLHGVIDDRAAALGFRPDLRSTGPLPELSRDVVTDLLAVLAKALTNVARHAPAGSVHVDVVVTDDDVTLHVLDDGIGLRDAPSNGGLADLRRRADWHGGTLTVQAEPAGGTRLTWAVPRRPGTPAPQPPLSPPSI